MTKNMQKIILSAKIFLCFLTAFSLQIKGTSMCKNTQGIILAAGKATRFNTGRTKLIEKVCGLEMVAHTIQLLKRMEIPIVMVVGYQKDTVIDTVKKYLNNITFVTQENQCGTGHAVSCTQDTWCEENILILNGDVPLITEDIIENLYDEHIKTDAVISFITSHTNDIKNCSYGRVIQKQGSIEIIEAKDFTGNPADHCCINAGIYIIKQQFLREYLATINQNNAKNEFYLTDLVKIASDNNYTVTTVAAPFDKIHGINTFKELWEVEQIKKSEIISYWMANGVHFIAPQNVIIDLTATIGAGTTIGSGVHLLGDTKIGANCVVDAFSIIENSIVTDNATIHPHSIIRDAHIGHNAQVGPFAHIRSNSSIEDHGAIGNFVEVKNSTIGAHTKAKHLSYLGDAQIGSQVNIGAGTITCNYDGIQKNTTVVEDGVHIGSNNALIAPVTIEKNAVTAAGSVITENVPADALAIARARQVNKEGYAKKLRAKKDTSNFIFISAKKTNHMDDTSSSENI